MEFGLVTDRIEVGVVGSKPAESLAVPLRPVKREPEVLHGVGRRHRTEPDVRSRRRGSMRVATVVLTLMLLAGCSGAGGGGASGSPVVPLGSRVVTSPTTEALTESPIDLTSLSGRIVFDNFQDVWSINADGTGLRRLTHSPEP